MKERSTGKLWLPLMAACLLMMGIFSLSVSTKAADNDSSAPEIPGLTFQSEMQNEFAECFHIYYYNDDYTLIDVPDSGQFLLVPEGKSAPDGLDEDIVVLQKPLDNIYLAATSAMSLFSSLDALDDIKFSSLQASGWYVDAAKQAMENGVLPTPDPSADPASEPTQQPEDAAPTQEPAGNGQSNPSQPITMDYALKNMGKIQSKMSSGDKSAIMSIVISRLTADDKRQIAEMMKDGISGSDMSAGMAIARQRLTGSDISQILSIVQKYAGENE